MSNRAVVPRDPLGDNHGASVGDIDDERQKILEEQEEALMGKDANSQGVKYSLPVEPTESVDKNREYPPIVTVDGRVDTDIDHLMENSEEDYQDLAFQEIPSDFPKPQVVRVIDGSLDDDIDNLMNHDGTMAHTLVDAPKHFNRSDLKEINSHKSGKKYPARAQGQKNISFNKMSQDQSDGDISYSDGSEVVPFYDGNNSSNMVLDQSSSKVVQAQQNVENEVSLADMEEATEHDDVLVNGPAPSPVQEHGDACLSEKSESAVLIIDRPILGDKAKESESGCDACNPKEEEANSFKSKDEQSKEESVAATKPNSADQTDKEDISDIIKQFLANMSKEDIAKSLGADSKECKSPNETMESGNIGNLTERNLLEEASNAEKDSTISKDVVKRPAKSTDSQQTLSGCKSFCEPHCAKCVTVDVKETKQSSSVTDEGSKSTNTSMQDSVALLKSVIESLMKDTISQPNSQTDSQKMLAVTALKVAGDSMNAAAKMADALTLLVKNSQSHRFSLGSDLITAPVDSLWGKSASTSHTADLANEPESKVTPNPPQAEQTIESIPMKEDVQSKDDLDESLKEPKTQTSPVLPEREEEPEDKDKGCSGKKEQTVHGSSRNKSRKRGESRRKDESSDREDVPLHDKRAHTGKIVDQCEVHPMHETTLETSPEYWAVKSQRRKSNEPETKERNKRSSRKHLDGFDNQDEKYNEQTRGHRRDGSAKEKRKHEVDRHKRSSSRKPDTVESPEMDRQLGVWMAYNASKDMDPAVMEAAIKRHEKQMGYVIDRDRKMPSMDDNAIDTQSRSSRTKSHRDRKQKSRTRRQSIQDSMEINSHTSYEKNSMFSEATAMSGRGAKRHRKSNASSKSSLHQRFFDVFEKSAPWTFPDTEPGKCERYFDQVVRHLKPYSPVRLLASLDPNKEFIRAKLVGTCVDPYARDSDFDSLEFNGNAQLSESRLVQCQDDNDLHSEEDSDYY